MKWSWKIGEFAGIGVFVHWTFLLIVGWVLFAHMSAGEGLAEALRGLVFVLSIFACVVLHEFGHALTARRFGIRTRDITLLPIGGVARLERMPEDPRQELLVALAGPAVNAAIAMMLLIPVGLFEGFDRLFEAKTVTSRFFSQLMFVNTGLAVFNLLPAFPMDGGRVLRALLVPRLGYVRATETAATVGQAVAILFGMLGLFTNGMLLFIAIFVYLGAQQEAHMAQVHALFQGIPVREAMMTRFRTLAVNDMLDTAVYELLAGDQRDFPVVEEERVVGMLRRGDLIETLGANRPPTRVGEVMQRDCGSVAESAMLEQVFEQMNSDGVTTVPVVRHERLVGVVSLENIGEWLLIQSARRHLSPSRTKLPGAPS